MQYCLVLEYRSKARRGYRPADIDLLPLIGGLDARGKL
jgi:hypothetical protein